MSGASGSVAARELLDGSERLWAAEPVAALHCDGSPDSRHRRALVLDALRAYERLRAGSTTRTDPLAVFRRWPVCTVVALVAAAAADRPAAWLHGWATAWTHAFARHHRPEQLAAAHPGLATLLDAAARLDPATSGGNPAEVRLDIDSGALVVQAGPGWTVEAGGSPAPPAAGGRLVTRPVPFVTVRDPLGLPHRLPVVDPADPLVLFSDDGRWVPPDAPLPAGEAWLLHLHEPPAECFDGPVRVLEHAVPPVGWSRWWLGRVLLDGTPVRSSVDGGRSFGAWRTARSTAPAEFVVGPPVEGLTDLDGNPVLAEPPLLRLPGTSTDLWTVEVRKVGDVAAASMSAAGGSTVCPADAVHRPAVGRFHLRAHTAGRRTVSGQFTIAEGISLESVPQLRMLARGGGLRIARTAVRTPAGVRPTTPAIHFRREETSRDVDLYADGDATPLRLRVELPHSAVRTRVGQVNGPWEITPRPVSVEELDAGVHLDVRIPRAVRDAVGSLPELVAGPAPDQALQRLSGRRVTADVYRYDLRKLGDTVRAAGLVTMWLDLPGQEAPVAIMRGAQPVVTGIKWTAGRLRLLGRRPAGALTVRVQCAYAPWLAAFTAQLDEGATELELPAPFREGGPVIVTVLPIAAQVPDGWVDPGSLPRAVVMFRVGPEDQVPALQSPVAGAMAGYLAGRGPIPESTDALHLLWIAAARAPMICLPALAGVTAQECAAVLGAHPVAALSAVARAGLDTPAAVGPLVRSGLSTHPLRRVDDPAAVQRLWAAAPLPALLLTSPLLPYLTADPAWDPAELEPAEERLLDELRTRCSPTALDILATGTTRTGALFDPSIDVSEPRGIAAPAADDLEQLHRFATGSVHATGIGATLSDRPPAGTLSLGCALAARLAAHGDRVAVGIERHLRHSWVAIARAAPLMVANDIALAELLATHWNTHSKEPSP